MALASYLRRLVGCRRPRAGTCCAAALLTGALGLSSLFYNLTIDALGYERIFLGRLETVARLAALALLLPLWWLVEQRLFVTNLPVCYNVLTQLVSK